MKEMRAFEVILMTIFIQVLFGLNTNARSLHDPSDNFSLQGQVYDGDFTISGVTINFYIEEVKIISTTSNNRGSFNASLHHNTIYTVEALKEGYIPEKVVLNTNVSTEVLRNGGIGETFDFTISMFRDYPGLKSEAFNEPLVYYVFNAKKGWFFEPDARKSKMGIISQTQVKTAQLKEKDYFRIIQDGDKALAKNKTEDAFFKYVQAFLIFPDDITAREKAGVIVKAYKKEKILDDFFQRVLENADNSFKNNDYENARAYYNYAKMLKPKEKYPKNKLNTIDSITSFLYLRNRNIYDSLKFSAEDKYKENDYTKSLGDYETALKLFPNDAYLKHRIISINKLIHQNDPKPSVKENTVSSTDKNKKIK